MDPAAGKVIEALLGTGIGTAIIGALALYRWWSTGPENRAIDQARTALSAEQREAFTRLRGELQEERSRADRLERLMEWWRSLAWWWFETARDLRHAANGARATMQAVASMQQKGLPLPEMRPEEWQRLAELPAVDAPIPRPVEKGRPGEKGEP